MGNKIVHIEFMGADGAGQEKFYSDIFGWDTEEVPGFNHYYMVSEESAGQTAAVGQGPEESPSYLTVYVEVESIDDHLAKIADAGGQTIMPRTVVPDVITFAMFADPAGNVVGLTEAGSG
ncbi:MAG: VOC family protein [Acidimicrobiia bacterium]|nr:VOC family protein [Acidimicrobiia bacterium]